MKKILIIANVLGFVSDFLRSDIELLISNGYEVEVAGNENYLLDDTLEYFKQKNIRSYHVPFPVRSLNIKSICESYFTIKKLLRVNNYNVIHCHTPIVAALARQCAKKYRKRGLKVIYTSHGFPFYKGNEGKKAKLFKFIENYYSRYTDGIITICQEDYVNAKKMHCRNVKLMHGVGVNVDRFINTKIDREEYRTRLGFKESDKVVLAIGELNTNKNHQVIIKALNRLNDNNLILAICGREVTEIGKKDELQKLADKLNVRIKFLGFRKDIPEVCRCADIGVLPSFKEGLGLSGIEMLASGMPVVGSNRQGIKDYIVDGETGYLADPTDEDSFVLAIEKCLKIYRNENVKHNCVEKSKEFGIEQAKKVIDDVYKSVDLY